MKNDTQMTVDLIGLKGNQKRAVELRGQDIVVTAGAGSGKTRTLVHRYLSLLGEGISPRQILAITFTEKAAREMRNRIRASVRARADIATTPLEETFWRELEAAMDAARISTIHSFCAELLRSHPAETSVDPDFEVVEEGMAAVLRARAVEDALAWTTEDPEAARLFSSFSPLGLAQVVSFLLARRLDAAEMLAGVEGNESKDVALRSALQTVVEAQEVADRIAELQRMRAEGALLEDAGDKLQAQLIELLDLWVEFEERIQADDLVTSAAHLYTLRREHMKLGAGKRTSRAKELLRNLQGIYDATVDPWLGGSKSGDPPPDANVEERFAEDLPRLYLLFDRALQIYRSSLDARRALDFDDLEEKALQLLSDAVVRDAWQLQFTAVMVDEFQDTNERQKRIVEALCGDVAGRLFVVGDARQSIYRFRGADVTVFREIGQTIEARGGEPIELDLTFRAHPGLLKVLDQLLPPIMGDRDDPDRLYAVPYTSITAHRESPREGIEEPFVEFLLGVGEDAEAARPHAARALVRRLIELREEGQIQAWDDVALLFRASTGFAHYEDALEALGVPFVTIAGRGFYERPEIRDILNILRTLADQWDDLAMAGLLRSPAFGLSDSALYKLRWSNDGPRPLCLALRDSPETLSESDSERVVRAQEILDELEPLVDRLPVAELLKRVIDRMDYRAAMASGHHRYWQNLDKLLVDAHASGLVRVREFLEYIRTIRDVGVREGEAPVEAAGAVRLMTIHKAKGLEFPVVILADASRRLQSRGEAAHLMEDTGLAFKPDRLDGVPLAYGIAAAMDQEQSKAEESRLLYVAMTRAREKLVVSGHCTESSTGLKMDGWMKALGEVAGIDLDELVKSEGKWRKLRLEGGEVVGVCLVLDETGDVYLEDEQPAEKWPTASSAPLYKPLDPGRGDELDPELEEEPARNWRATGERVHPPAAAVGVMVHKALERWLFPGDEGFGRLLESVALNEGLVETGQRKMAIRLAQKLLDRFKGHPLYEEIEASSDRHHEIPYTREISNGWSDSGVIDLLYRVNGQWKLIDFKADELRDEDSLDAAADRYRGQIRRYHQAATELLGEEVITALCFLDCAGEVRVVEL